MKTIVQASAVENLILSLSKDEVFGPCPGIGRRSMISTESPGKIAKWGWFSNIAAAAVDFGKPVSVRSAELSFFADDKAFAGLRAIGLRRGGTGRQMGGSGQGRRPTGQRRRQDGLAAGHDIEAAGGVRSAPGQGIRLIEMKVF